MDEHDDWSNCRDESKEQVTEALITRVLSINGFTVQPQGSDEIQCLMFYEESPNSELGKAIREFTDRFQGHVIHVPGSVGIPICILTARVDEDDGTTMKSLMNISILMHK